MSFDFVVVGAGITGAATAYYLQKSGAGTVLLLDRHGPAAGGTGKSAAIIRQHYSNALAADLTRESIAIFASMADELGYAGGFVQSGYHMLVPPDMLAGARDNVALLKNIGIATELRDGVGCLTGLDWINPDGIAGVVHEPDGGYADPVLATEAFVGAFQTLGGTLQVKTPARSLAGSNERVTGVVTDDGTVSAGLVVNAAGPWAGALGRSVGLDMPLRAVREQDTVWEVLPDRPLPETPISNAVDAIYLRPLGARRFVVGRGFPKSYEEVDPDRYDRQADEDFVMDVIGRLEHRMPPFHGARRIDAYAALYDVTPDWYPFVGPRKASAGYVDAWGGSGHGFKLAPAIGRRLAAWITTGETDEAFRRLSHDRIALRQNFTQKYGGNRG